MNSLLEFSNLMTNYCIQVANELQKQRISLIIKSLRDVKGIEFSIEDEGILRRLSVIISCDFGTMITDRSFDPIKFERWKHKDGTPLITFIEDCIDINSLNKLNYIIHNEQTKA